MVSGNGGQMATDADANLTKPMPGAPLVHLKRGYVLWHGRSIIRLHQHDAIRSHKILRLPYAKKRKRTHRFTNPSNGNKCPARANTITPLLITGNDAKKLRGEYAALFTGQQRWYAARKIAGKAELLRRRNICTVT